MVLMPREEVAKMIAQDIENHLRKLFPKECSKRDEEKENEKNTGKNKRTCKTD